FSAFILLAISAFFTIIGGLRAIAYTNVYQMVLLIFVSATLTVVGIWHLGGESVVGGINTLADSSVVPSHYWNLFQPNDHKEFPWLPILLGYPISGLWFWCTDQSMVQPVLAARDLNEGQKGANFTGWLKILDVAIYIIPGVVCFALWKKGFFGDAVIEPDHAYMTLVSNLFPVGMVGLVIAVLTAALISTIGSALNALSTVFTMDIYVKNINTGASQAEIVRTGHIVTVVGALVSILITIAVDNIKGMDLFNVFQSVLSFIAPPMAAVFVMGVFWKRCTTLAANIVLTFGTIFSIGCGVLYLWVIPNATEQVHFMMLSFIIFVVLIITMIAVSMMDKASVERAPMTVIKGRMSLSVQMAWLALAIVMIGLYMFFNGH
ncbi:MAG: sodium/solute symporter, partial [Duncaniella sp.]|nr:sodium/solute symporter [Duncaniella sp.]